MPHPATTALPPLRASDLEREHTAGLLREYLLAGRLTIAEFEERLEEAWCARFVDDLWEALRELPARDPEPASTTSHFTSAPPAPYLPPARAAPCLTPDPPPPAHGGRGVAGLVLGCAGATLLVLSVGLLWPLALCACAPAWALGRSARRGGAGVRGQALTGEVLGAAGTVVCLLALAGCAAIVA